MLRKAGWKLEEKNVKEYEIDGIYTNKSGKGKIDYVLWGDKGYPLAVIEAKRTIRDAKVGRHQVLEYAEAIEKDFGFFPVRFCTNGFETFIYEHRNLLIEGFMVFIEKKNL